MPRLSVPKDAIRVVLLEGVHDSAARLFAAKGYGNIERLATSPPPEDLDRILAKAHIVGIRSRTQLPAESIARATRLFCIGCFCIGTNQVDLAAAKQAGIPIFNAPYSNTRSVAELVLGEVIMLLRRIPEKSALAHRGIWQKTDAGAHEVRGKTLGIVGYGHIGSQLSVLAEAIGMHVRYFDIVEKLALGNASPVGSLAELMSMADVVSLHVPATQETRGMIGASEIARMRAGSMLVNAARGEVVDLEALGDALRRRHLAGAALDVFPVEPAGGAEPFSNALQGLDNVILTPHVGGATEEAQESIGSEVADKLVRYSDSGATTGAVNFVEVSLPTQRNATRFLHIHQNVPGVLSRINAVFSAKDLNIAGQYLRTDAEVGYVVTDIDGTLEAGTGLRRALAEIPGTLRVRFLY